MNFKIKMYVEGSECPFEQWIKSLEGTTRARIYSNIRRLEYGNFGNAKTLTDGVSELRMHFGAGYRIYFGIDGKRIILLLGGGDKKTQQKDIHKAVIRWKRFNETRQ